MTNPKPNLSKGEQKAMEELAKRKDIIITNADKGSAVVIMDFSNNTSTMPTASYPLEVTRRPNATTQ